MNFVEAMATWDAVGKADPKSFDGAELAAALLVAADQLRKTWTGLSIAGVDGAPAWLGFETAIWMLSERLRPVLSVRKDWRTGSEMLESLHLLCSNPDYAKGRQNFALMLGEFGGQAEAARLKALLQDLDVRGHAIKALTKLRDESGKNAVKDLLPRLKGWHRAAAMKYIALTPTDEGKRVRG